MKTFVMLFALAAFVGSGTAMALSKPNCYSARGCGGKILSHRDKHNCKVKSHGKSWRSAPGAACEDL